MNKKVIIIGASGHGKVIADIILKSNDIIVGFLDDGIKKGTVILGCEVLGKTEDCVYYQDECEFVIGIGSNQIRERIAKTYDLKWYTAIHPTAIIACDVQIQEGTVIMANSVINVCTTIGKHCIVNTCAVIEHDSKIEDYVHVSPNATLCGTIIVGKRTHIGAGVVVRNNLTIASDVVIGLGAVVVKDILEKGCYVGIPAKKLQQ